MIKDTIEKVRKLIGARSYAYKYTFRDENEWGKIVLRDLAQFCRAYKSTYHSDPRMQALLEGRREVFVRIQEYLRLTDNQIFELHQVKHLPIKQGD